MKIVLVHGQNHKGSTWHISRILVDAIEGEHEVREFFLPRDLEYFCLGCYSCVQDESKCPFFAEKQAIMQEIERADLLIFTTPTYCMAPSAPMKAFMDLTFTYWMPHKPRACMFAKRAVVISTAAGTGMKQAIAPVARMLFYWGVPQVKKYGASVQAMSWDGVSEKKKDKITRDMRKLARGLSDGKRPRVLVKTKFMFEIMSGMQKNNMGSGEEERQYWERMGWLKGEKPWKKR